MKRLVYLVLVLALAGLCSTAAAAERSDFRFTAPVESDERRREPIRLALSPEVIAKTSAKLEDLRIFDDSGKEIPYVVYRQERPGEWNPSFNWKIIGYETSEGAQIFQLERPEEGGAPKDLTLLTADRDFNKAVAVYSSRDCGSWQLIAEGRFFDFGSQVDLRQTTLELPEANARYLKIVLRSDGMPTDGEDFHLRYKDLEFTRGGRKNGAIRVDGFTSSVSEKSIWDCIAVSPVSTFLDRDGNTVLTLGRVNVPIERVGLKIKNKNKYFYRHVEFWTAESDDEKAYRRIGADVVYAIPGITQSENTLGFDQPRAPFVRLRIINHDNPPLEVEQVRIEWVRRNLYFIPEEGRRYALYCGGQNVETPQYEAEALVPNHYDELSRYAEWKLDSLRKNEAYAPRADQWSRTQLEKYLLMGIVILVMGGLSFWVFRLARKIPDVNRKDE